VFDEEELDKLKLTIRNLTEGKIQPKQLKQILLQSRGRIVKDISNFISFCVDRVRGSTQTPMNRELSDSNQFDLVNDQLRQEIVEKNNLLKAVAINLNALVVKAKKSNME